MSFQRRSAQTYFFGLPYPFVHFGFASIAPVLTQTPQLGTVLLFNILRPRNKVFPSLPAAAGTPALRLLLPLPAIATKYRRLLTMLP